MELSIPFLLGFAGSLHCAGMCGPLVLAMAGSAPVDSSKRRMVNRICYNLGRVSMYGVLGLLAGLVGAAFRMAGFQQALSLALGCLVLLCAVATTAVAVWGKRLSGLNLGAGRVYALVSTLKRPLSHLLMSRSAWGQYGLGFVNGLLPCGLVYAACAGAVASGSLLGSWVWMVVFGLGTVPMMLGLAVWGARMISGLTVQMRLAVPLFTAALGFLLVLRGLGVGIPFLSPSFPSEGPAACCPVPE